jgi:ABC-2 type transport system ATP-binding protein
MMIHLSNLSKQYDRTQAVDDINLKISKGEIFGFIGPNGAGKTTTIKMMGGILAPSAGSVIIDGTNMAEDPEKAKLKIGLIPDRPFLYDKLTGMEFLKFISDIYGVKASDFKEKADSLLAMFSLIDRGDELIESYSHGMKQRLIMAGALIHDPLVIIVDEPMVGLDPRGIKMVKDLFRRLSEKGTTVFMSTHTLKLAEDICHKIGIIHQGKLIATGTVDQLREQMDIDEADLEEVFFRYTN